MGDANLLWKSKLRLQQSKTLKDLAMNAVLSKLEAYTTEEDANFIQSKLSPQMRDAVLQKKLSRGFLKRFGTIEEYRSMQRSVFALMTTKTYNLDLCVLMSYHPRPDNDPNFLKDFIKILKMLSISAPNVRQLQMRSLDLCRFFANDEVRKVCLDYLGSLKELWILEIIGSLCKNAVLPLLCRELPSLQVLSAPEIPLLDTYMTEEDIRGSFGHLRLLHIEHLSIYKKYQIWQVLPYLNIIRNDQRNSSLTFEDFLEDENIPRERKYLNFDDHLMELNDCTDYTSIKFLEFSCETSWEEMKKILKRTTTLEGLTLKIMKNGAPFDDVLRECGAKLGYLSLTGDHYSSVELNSISQLCPRLKDLSMASVQVTAETFQQVNFSHLEELFTEDLELWMEGSFTAILTSSPNLRKLEINRDTCSLEKMQQIKYLIIEKKILGSLQSLRWHLGKSTPEEDFIEISSILKNASANLPDLRKLKLTFEYLACHVDFLVLSKDPIWIRTNFSQICDGLKEAIIADPNLIDILNFYE